MEFDLFFLWSKYLYVAVSNTFYRPYYSPPDIEKHQEHNDQSFHHLLSSNFWKRSYP